ncbi:MAG: type I restriction endonuclease subunit R [Thermogemmatispora sp.]|uniref:type I restriction endonuclease n=1 Tax=Thermogemmatispora sp. TaxID=1968838 RepID=UPI0026273702|nr:type I restriction endonuclease [Thermogemmatispora sp.]MBX5457294.1 type I restriction endonuclease subunit R [Thermogemmatispora sp.]
MEFPQTIKNIVVSRAIHALEQMGYFHQDASAEGEGNYDITGRGSAEEVVLLEPLRAALQRLNPEASAEQIAYVCALMTRNRDAQHPLAANYEIYHLLREGVALSDEGPSNALPKAQPGRRRPSGLASVSTSRREVGASSTLRLVDWQHPAANDWRLISNYWVQGRCGQLRLPLVGFVNGLPLLLFVIGIEPLEQLYQRYLHCYRSELPQLVWYNALVLLSNGPLNRVGSIDSLWPQLTPWKRLAGEDEPEDCSLETALYATCQPERLLDLVEHFTLFSRTPRPGKIVARNHQYLAVNTAYARLREAGALRGRLGLLWQAHGSGKSYTLAFLLQKVLRQGDEPGPTCLLVTGHEDLWRQLVRSLTDWGLLAREAKAGAMPVTTAGELQRLLEQPTSGRAQSGHSAPLYFALPSAFESTEPLSLRTDLLVLVDELQTCTLEQLQRMRQALPAAAFLGLTATPCREDQEPALRSLFGPYLSGYSCAQALADGAILPVYYEDRSALLGAQTPLGFAEAMQQLAEAAGPCSEYQEELAQRLRTPYALLTHPERLDLVARDLAEHWFARGYRAKALVLTIDKITAVRLYNRVRSFWERMLRRLQRERDETFDWRRRAVLDERLAYYKPTEMAVLVSPSPDDYRRFADFNDTPGRVYCETVEIRSHHERLHNEDLVARFHDANDPLRLVFSCDPWLASLAAPALATLYLDRPLQGPTLLAALTAVNRVYDDEKVCGLVVDYIGHWPLLSTLQQRYARAAERVLPQSWRLRRRASREAHEPPVAEVSAIQEKHQLVAELEKTLGETLDFCARHGVEVAALLAASEERRADGAARQAADRLLKGNDLRQSFFAQVKRIEALYAALQPDEAAPRFSGAVEALGLVARIMRRAQHCRSLDELLDRPQALAGLLAEESPTARYGGRSRMEAAGSSGKPSLNALDLQRVSFSRLATLLKKSRTPLLKAEQLRSLLAWNLQLMSSHQPRYAEALAHLEKLQYKYESGQAPWEEYPADLLLFVRSLLDSSAAGKLQSEEKAAGSHSRQRSGSAQPGESTKADSDRPPDRRGPARPSAEH